MNVVFAVRLVQWAFTLFSIAGIAVSTYTALDAWSDLRARARAGLNGHLEVAGRIARRGAVASVALHLGFLFIGLTALASPLPPTLAASRSITVGLVFCAMQFFVVAAQLRNQVDRSTLRGGPDVHEGLP